MGAPSSPAPAPPPPLADATLPDDPALPDASPPPPSLLRLRCGVQHYEWGRRGDASLVARLAAAAGFQIDPALPYAELWMGTHPAAPALVLPAGEPLGAWLARNRRAALGAAVDARWGGDLPFLFKVLSVAKPLSIQAHPDKGLAEKLHAQRPDAYKDANHKPEMAIALTDFRALFGFTGIEELKDVIRTVPEVARLIHEDVDKLMTIKEYHGGNDVKSILKSTFAKLMKASKEAVSEAVNKLKGRLNDESKIRTLTEKEQVILSLERQYPEDVGVLAALLFNYVKLSPGEAIYIGANEPHAYLSGDCIECMATSDNVVRAGLTPKYRDVENLCDMLTYKQVFPEILRGVPVQRYVRRYTPPTDEFEVDCFSLPTGEVVIMSPAPSPSIFLVITGEGEIQVGSMVDGEKAKEGDVFFVPANTQVTLSACDHASMQLYRAGVNSNACGTAVGGKRSQLQNMRTD
uniref:Uncharacterized protein n=1 Tax=Avena sativa TaxID=4498 RepID=A0ACD5VJE3_AVESA